MLEAAIRAEARTGETATLAEIAEEHGTAINNVREFLIQLAAIGYVGTRKRGRHTSYFVLLDADGRPFDRRAAHAEYLIARTTSGLTRAIELTDQIAAHVRGAVGASCGVEAIEEAGVNPLAELRARHPDARAVVLRRPIEAHGLRSGDVLFVEARAPRAGTSEWAYGEDAVVAAFLWLSSV